MELQKRTALWVFAIGACLTALLAGVQRHQNTADAARRFEDVADHVAAQILERMDTYEYGLRGGRGAVVVSADDGWISRPEFLSYSATRDVDREFPGARGFGVIWRVPEAAEGAFVEQVRAEGWPDFEVHQLSPSHGERFIIHLIEPVERNLQAMGLDIASEHNRRAAALRSMYSGEATLTGPITLVQATGKPLHSFLVMIPIYRPGASLDAPEERAAATLGWSYAPLVIDEVLDGIEGMNSEFVMTLTDTTDPEVQDFYRSDRGASIADTGLAQALTLSTYGRTWSARIVATPAFVQGLNQLSPLKVAGVGGLVSALSALVAFLVAKLAQNHQQVQAEQARRAAIVESTADGIIGMTLDGEITDWNRGAEELFGYPASQAIGRSASRLLLPAERQEEDIGLRRQVSERGALSLESTRQHRDGSLVEVAITASPILDADGRCVGISKTLRDIREAREARRALAALNDSLEQQVSARTAELNTTLHDLRTILDALPSMIGYWDSSLVNRVANRAYGQWLGKAPEALRGRSLRELFGEALFQKLQPRIQAALGGEPQSFEIAIPDPAGGTRNLLAHYLPDVVGGEVPGFYVLAHDVTELTRSRAQLAAAQRDNAALLQAIHEHSIVSVTDRRGRIIEVNDSFCRISGYSREELLGRSHRLINSGVHGSAFWREVWRVISSGRPWRGELCNLAKDGSLYWVDSIIAPFMGEDGLVERYVSIRSDITSRKLFEQSLRSTNERFEIASGAAGIGVWEYDVGAGEFTWDARVYEQYGFPPSGEREPRRRWLESLHREDRGRVVSELEQAVSSGSTLETEFRIWRSPGDVRHLRVSARVSPGDDGAAARMTGVSLDITAQKAAEEELLQTSTMLQSVLDAASEVAIIAFNAVGVVSLFNSGAENLLGWRAEEVLGRETLERFHLPGELEARLRAAGLSDAPAGARLPALLRSGALLGHQQEWRYVCKGGEQVPVSVTMAPIHGEPGEVLGYLAVAQDISTQQAYERSLRAALTEANAASAAKGRFLANMSHEIRTPMNAVLGLSRLLESTPLDPSQADLLRKIRNAGTSLLGILNDVLDLSKIEAGELELESVPFEVTPLLEELAELMQVQAAARQIGFVLDVPEPVSGCLVGDPHRLRQVLLNLLSNAIKFTEQGEVRLGMTWAEVPGGRRLRFAVSDTGEGIAPEQLSRLFSPFVQADASTTRRFGGTGLGLSIVKQLVNLMGGELSVESRPGEGSTFCLELALERTSEPAIAALDGGHALGAAALHGAHILLADDNPLNQEVARRILELEGAGVTLADNGQEALERLAASPGGFDVVLLDVQMPILDGHETARRIRSELGLRELPLIALTAGTMVSERQQAFEAGMDAFIGKPFQPEVLVQCIYEQLRRTVRREAPPAAVAAAGAPADWKEIPGIDIEDTRQRLCGDWELYRTLLRRFLRDHSAPPAEASAPLEFAPLAAWLHRFKGTAGTLGATELWDRAVRAEAACRAHQEEQTRHHLQALMRSFEALRRHVEGRPDLSPGGLVGEGPQVSGEASLEPGALQALLGLLQDSDFAAVEGFSKLAPQLRARLGEQGFAEITAAMEELRFEEVARRLLPLKEAA